MSEFIVVANVKKLVRSHNNQSSPEFLEALDAFVSAKVRACCELYGENKRLDATAVHGSLEKKNNPSDLREKIVTIKDEAVDAELQVNIKSRAEFLKAIHKIKSVCDSILEGTNGQAK